MSYTVYHLLGHVHGVYNSTDEVLKEVLTLIPIGKVKQRKLMDSLRSTRAGGYSYAEHDGCRVLIMRNK